MADYSFGYGGIGSGLDISTMVSQLVAADRAPQDARLNKLEASAKFKLSALGNISSAFSTLKGRLDALQKAESLGARKVETIATGGSADSASPAITATVGGNTPAGRYEVQVHALATAHKLVGAGIPADTAFGAGAYSARDRPVLAGRSMTSASPAGRGVGTPVPAARIERTSAARHRPNAVALSSAATIAARPWAAVSVFSSASSGPRRVCPAAAAPAMNASAAGPSAQNSFSAALRGRIARTGVVGRAPP